MLRVGLTGGIACGKTVVRRLLAERGAYTIDADSIVHELLGPDTELSRQIAEHFGTDVLARDGSVDRARLGKLVFDDPDIRRRLNELVHPRVIEEQERLLSEAEARAEPLAVVDAALMIEVGTYRKCDFLIVVHCPRRLQIERLLARDHLTEEEAVRRVDAQMPVEEKKQYADYVIDTSGTLEDTERQVGEVWDILQKLWLGGSTNS